MSKNMRPLSIPKLDLNSCAINTLTPIEQPKLEKKNTLIKEIIKLLQSAFKFIQGLIRKL